MLVDFFVTKLGMSQAWTKNGKRLAITRCQAYDNIVVGSQAVSVVNTTAQNRSKVDATILELGVGSKALKNVKKPLRTRLEKSGFSQGVQQVRGSRILATESKDELPVVGAAITVDQVLEVGDVVQVQGLTKGRGFAGAMKRHGFHGGPATHGQSDRSRAVGSIGAGTTPGRVWKGKRMPGHFGTDVVTVTGLVVLHVDSTTKEVWLSGPIPGSNKSFVRIRKTGEKKTIELDRAASGVPEVVTQAAETQTQESVQA